MKISNQTTLMSRIIKKTNNVIYTTDLFNKDLYKIFINMKRENDSYMKNRAENEPIYYHILKCNNEIFNGLKRREQAEMILVNNLTIKNRLN